MSPTTSTVLWRRTLLIFCAALIVRLVFVLLIDPAPSLRGGDTNWYMHNGHQLVTTGKTPGPLQTAPLYPVFLGIIQVLDPASPARGHYYTTAEMQIARSLQAIMGAAVCAAVYLIARRLFSERAGLLAGVLMIVSPVLIIEAGNLTSEGLFLFFLFMALLFYLYAKPTPPYLVLVGALFGLATLTRAVFLLFPLGLVLHLFLVQRRYWLRLSLALLTSYALIVSTWTIYNLAVWDRLVVGGEGFWSFIYLRVDSPISPEEVDQQLEISDTDDQQDRTNILKTEIKKNITNDPVGWFMDRFQGLAKAYIQPHNTVYYPGESIRDAVSHWLREDHSLAGLVDLTRIESFWPKLALYLFHFGGLALGVLGMLWSWRQWRVFLPLYGLLLYFTGIHLVLMALPRYLFPMYPIWWIFAAGWIGTQWASRRVSGEKPSDERLAAADQAVV